MDPTQTFILEMLKILMTGIVAFFVARLTTVTKEMSGRLDGKLDELKGLWQSEAHLKGREEQRSELEAAAAVAATTARQDAKEDRAEGVASVSPALVPAPVDPTVPVPVETRTEAERHK